MASVLVCVGEGGPGDHAGWSSVRDAEGRVVPLRGWAQSIRVEKVDPTNYSTVYPAETTLPADASGFAGLAVDAFPLRVTVTVTYQGPFDTEEQVVAVVTWIVP